MTPTRRGAQRRCGSRAARTPLERAPSRRRSATWTALAVAIALGLGLLTPGAAGGQAGSPPSLLSLVATVVAAAGLNGPTATGSVTIQVDLKTVATIALVDGAATLSTASLGPGMHTVIVLYSGDTNHPPGVSIATLPGGTGELGLTISVNPTAPAVSITTPANGAHYANGASVAASYLCIDPDGSADLATCSGPVPAGSPIDTAAAGSHTFAVQGVDQEGNTASAVATYVVDQAPAGVPAQAQSAAPAGPVAQVPVPVPPFLAAPAPAARAVTPRLVVPRAAPTARAHPKAATRRAPRSRSHSGAAPTSPQPRTVTGRSAIRAYDARSQPAKVVGVEVGAFALLTLLGGGGFGLAGLATVGAGAAGRRSGGGGTRSGDGGGGADGGGSFDVDYEGVDVAFLGAGAGFAFGDRSGTWRWPGTRALDSASTALPARLIARFPLLARVADDGAYLRSMLGVMALSAEVGGVVLGVLAVDDTGGRAIPPALALTIAIMVLGIADATAGLLAVLVFVGGVVVDGGLDSAAAVRTLLALAALWFVVPVLAGASRPLRREPAVDAKQRFDRAGDLVIASLIGAWAVQKLVLALPGLAGLALPIGSHADELALWALGALAVRIVGETLAAHLYPRRLVSVRPGALSEPGSLQRLWAATLRTAIFVFIAAVVVGWTWQLWVAGVLFLVPQALAAYDERFPKSRALGGVLPEGMFELVLMLFLLTGLGALLLESHSKSLIADSFVLLAIPGAVFATLHFFGEAEEREDVGWGARVAGTFVVLAGVLQVLGLLF